MVVRPLGREPIYKKPPAERGAAPPPAGAGVGLTHDAFLLELDLDHDQRWSGLDEARFDRHLVLVELDAGDLGVAG